MKDLIFFIFVILCLMTSAFVAEIKTPFFPNHAGSELLYQIETPQKHRYYLQKTIEEVENIDTMSVIHYTVSVFDKNHNLYIPDLRYTTSLIQDTAYFYSEHFFPKQQNEKIRFNGPGFPIPPTLSIGQKLKDGYFIIQGSYLLTRIDRKNRSVKAKTRLKTPAGNFTCYLVEASQCNTTSGVSTFYKTLSWYTPGIGIIKSETYSENGKLTSKQVLVSIKNNPTSSSL